MTFAAYTVALDLDGNGSYETDITTYTLDVNIKRGRSKELAAVDMGSCTIVLDNSDGRFNPEYAAGPYFGTLEVYVPVQVTAVLSAVTYYLFTGYITKIQPEIRKGSTCTFSCVDLFLNLRNFHLNLALAETKLTGDRMDAILDAFDATVSAAADLDTGQTTLPLYYARNTDALTALQELADHDLGGMIFIAGNGVFTFRDRHSRALSTSSGTITRMQGLDYDRGEDQIYNKVVLQGGGFETGVAGSQIWSYFPLPVQLAQGATLVLDPNFVQPAKTVTTPVSGTDYIANVNSDGSGTDLSSDIVSTFTDYGGGAAWRLTNNSPNNVWFTTLQIRGTPLGLPTGLRSVDATAGSSPLPFDKTFEASYRFITDLSLLQDFADYIITHYNAAQPRITLTLRPHGAGDSDAQLIQMLARELNDRITITDTTFAYSSQINGDYFIESVEHRITDGCTNHETVWLCTTFSNDAFFILDTSVLDGVAVLGY